MTTLCNHKINGRRCRKPAAYGFRPYEHGWDVTDKYGIQYRCEKHGSWILINGEIRTSHTWKIEQKEQTS